MPIRYRQYRRWTDRQTDRLGKTISHSVNFSRPSLILLWTLLWNCRRIKSWMCSAWSRRASDVPAMGGPMRMANPRTRHSKPNELVNFSRPSSSHSTIDVSVIHVAVSHHHHHHQHYITLHYTTPGHEHVSTGAVLDSIHDRQLTARSTFCHSTRQPTCS